MTTPRGRLPVTVLGGYLGSGKTTLINAALTQADRRLAVVVNDVGELGIDASLISGRGGDVWELANGCVCCSMAGDLVSTLDQLAGLAPEHIIIEVSGVGSPGQVAQMARVPPCELDAVLVTADATTVGERSQDRLVGDTIRTQLAGADLVVITKTDLVEADELAAVDALVAELAGQAPRVTSDQRGTAGALLVAPRPAHDRPTAPAGRHPAHVSRSWEFGELDRAQVDAWLDSLPPQVWRAKGILALSDGSGALVQQVGRRRQWTPIERPSRGRLVAVADPGSAPLAPPPWMSVS